MSIIANTNNSKAGVIGKLVALCLFFAISLQSHAQTHATKSMLAGTFCHSEWTNSSREIAVLEIKKDGTFTINVINLIAYNIDTLYQGSGEFKTVKDKDSSSIIFQTIDAQQLSEIERIACWPIDRAPTSVELWRDHDVVMHIQNADSLLTPHGIPYIREKRKPLHMLGAVADNTTGKPIPNAKIKMKNGLTSISHTVADENGKFMLASPQIFDNHPARHRVVVTAKGYRRSVLKVGCGQFIEYQSTLPTQPWPIQMTPKRIPSSKH